MSDADVVKSTIENLEFFSKLDELEKERILKNSIIKTYSKNQILYDHNSECLGMVVPLSGTIRVTMASENGKEINLYTLEQGDVDVLSASCVINQISFDTVMIAEDNCDVIIIPAIVVSEVQKKNIYLHSYILEIAANRFSDVMWTMQQILFMRIDQRIAIFLLDEYVKSHKNVMIKVTQEEIAKNINSAREVVTRILKRMSADDVIEIRRGKVIIKDIDYIKNLAIAD